MSHLSAEPETNFTNVINSRCLRRKTIDSYSVILHTLIEGKIYYLVGRIRDSIPFKEFVRGNIPEADVPRYFQHISQEEKHRILTEPFQELVDDIMVNHATRAYRSTCEHGEVFTVNVERWRALLEDQSVGLREAPWMFPKGRKMEAETDIACALREFEEETHIPRDMIVVYDDFKPLEEIYPGLDGKLYRTVYFLGYMEYSDYISASQAIRKQFVVTKYRTSLSEEIAKIKWLEYETTLQRLDIIKSTILREVNTFLVFHLKRPRLTRRHSV